MVKVDHTTALQYAATKHPLLNTISRPLKDYLGIDYFGYKRYYPTLKKYIFLSTNELWMNCHIKTVTSHGAFFSDAMDLFEPDRMYCVTWPDSPTDDFLEGLVQHDMWHGINLYQRTDEYIDLWTFSTSKVNEQFRFLRLNLCEDLKKFVAHFVNKTQGWLEDADEKSYAQLSVNPPPKEPLQRTIRLGDFREQFDHCPFLCVGPAFISLTRRESQCLKELSHGRSMKEIAILLKLSPRTVEGYLVHIKTKTGLLSKGALVSAYLSTAARF